LRRFRGIIALPFVVLLSACKAVVLAPSGDIAGQERDLLVMAILLMLLIIVPVLLLTVLFAWRYRASNNARYEPDWDHSMRLELIIWAGPLFIIVWLGALAWMGTHLLDPYRAISRIAAGQEVARDAKLLEVDVVALDWKWLFIYPQYGIATVNELAAPVNRPIRFRITASSVMNSFYIPALAGQIYAMPGMETKLHAVSNAVGEFKGFSANYSGAGFSGMHFAFRSLSQSGFNAWVSGVKAQQDELTRSRYLALERPSENVPVRKYGSVEQGLYNAILNMCVEPGKMCMSEMSAIDAKGGLGLAGIYNLYPLEHGSDAAHISVPSPSAYVASLCKITLPDMAPQSVWPQPDADTSPMHGANLPPPPFMPIAVFSSRPPSRSYPTSN
jgi:cytochrome o ubiquinol oxidase subunit 2